MLHVYRAVRAAATGDAHRESSHEVNNDKRLTPVLESLVQSSEGVKFIGNWNSLTARQHIKEKVKPMYDKRFVRAL